MGCLFDKVFSVSTLCLRGAESYAKSIRLLVKVRWAKLSVNDSGSMIGSRHKGWQSCNTAINVLLLS